jgi:hypothetical protein
MKRWHIRVAERRRRSEGEVIVWPTIVSQQREDGMGWHKAAGSRPHHRALGVGIPAGAATGGSSAAGSGDGTPRRTTADVMAHDGR